MRARAPSLVTRWSALLLIGLLPVLLLPSAQAQAQAQGTGQGRDADETATAPRVLLIAEQETTLVAPMAGTVQQLAGTLGGTVARGAVIARFECREQRARQGMARAELQAADEQLQAKERLQGLAAAGDVEVTLARSQLARARAQLELATAQVAQCVVMVPFDGRVARLHIREHQGVTVGQPLVDLVSSGPLRARLNVPSRWLGWLKPGSRFTVAIDETGRDYPALVAAINARVDAASQTIELEARLEGRHAELLAGMSGVARLVPPGR